VKIEDITAGTPASIVYPHDYRAAVVVKRTPKRVVIARVEVGPVRVIEQGGYGAITEAEGILTEVRPGTEQSYTLRTRKDGSVYGDRADGGRVNFGRSVDRINSMNF
jgi:hypothetical protein